MLMNSGHTFLFHKYFCTVYFRAKNENAVTLHIVHKGNMHFGGKSRKFQRQRNYQLEKKITLESLHQRLGDRSTRLLLAGDTANVWEEIEFRIDPDPFCTS